MKFNEIISHYALGLKREDIPNRAWKNAKIFFTDAVGCIIAGANEIPSNIASDYAAEFGGKPVCSVIGKKNIKTDPYNAITINGISAHFHDVDDVLVSIDGHPSVVILPAVLAAAEIVGATGEETLMAYITGVEVLKLIGIGFNKNARYYSIGWHSTATLGIFGATAAVGRLFGLTESQLVNALGIAASESSGLKGNFGTMVKPLHAGRAGAKAFYAVQIAKRGYISNPVIMEGSEGFAHVTVKTIDVNDVEKAMKENISAFIDPGLSMKAWPCCKQNHSAINAVQNLRTEYSFNAADVEKVECLVQPVSFDCLKYKAPTTKLQGKFSIQYNVALAILKGNVTLEDFDGTNIEDPEIFGLMKKISIEIDDSIAGGTYNNGRYDSIVKIHLKDGRTLEDWVVYAKGDPSNMMGQQEVMDKFLSCISRACNKNKLQQVWDNVSGIDKLSRVNNMLDTINDAVI